METTNGHTHITHNGFSHLFEYIARDKLYFVWGPAQSGPMIDPIIMDNADTYSDALAAASAKLKQLYKS